VEEVFFSSFLAYRVSDGSKLDILQQPAWCPNCGHFALAEDVPSLLDFEEEIASYRTGDPETLQKWAFISKRGPIEDRINELCPEIERTTQRQKPPQWSLVSNGAQFEDRVNELLKRIEWRKQRQNPPRCLECSSIGVTPIPPDGDFFHPETGKKVHVGAHGFADTAPWCAEFTTEGEPLV